MKSSRVMLILSLGANLLLAAAAMFFVFKSAPAAPEVREVEQSVVRTERVFVTNEPPVVETASATNAAFHWSAIESTNYEEYVANLRAMQCPSWTIRSIIAGELDERFVQQAASMISPLRKDFWLIAARFPENEERLKAEFSKIDEFEKERRELISRLLGDVRPEESRRDAESWSRQRYAFLPPEKAERLVALDMENIANEAELREQMKGAKEDEIRAKVALLTKEVARKKQEILSPEEAEEMRLRDSQAARRLRNAALPDYTEAETRALAKIGADFDEANPFPQRGDTNYQRLVEQRNAALEAQIKSYLGPQRYTDYARAQDQNFVGLDAFAQRVGLPRETTIKLYDLRQDAFKQADGVRKDNSLSQEERDVLLDVLMDQAQQDVTRTLGKNLAGVYLKNGGWIRELSQE